MVGKGVQNICIKEYQNSHFFPSFFFNVASSFNFEYRKLKFSMITLEMMMEGTVSQIFYLGLSF